MPSTEGLHAVSIADFSPGLYNATDWLVPAKGWQIMQDCYPQVGGGLRAFFKVDGAITTSGLENAPSELALGIHQRSGILFRDGSNIGADRYLSTYDTEDALPRMYRMDQTNHATTWTEQTKNSDSNPFVTGTKDGKTSFRTFELADGSVVTLFIVRYGGSDNGLWYLAYTPTAAAEMQTLNGGTFSVINGCITLHQARFVCGSNNGQIIWSEPGSLTINAANFLLLDPNKENTRIAALQGVEPSDLLALRQGAGFVVVQGADITSNPAVQVTNEGVGAGSNGFFDACSTPYGIAFISNDGYMYLTDGRTHTKISEQLQQFATSDDYTAYRDIVFLDDFLFNGGRVYDFRTKSWFSQTQLAGSAKYADRNENLVIGNVADGVGFALATLTPETGTTRVSTFTAKTAPLHGEDGRQLEMRQVDVYCKSYDVNATIAVTCNGTTKTSLLRTAGKQTARFLFMERAETLDVQFVSTAGDPSNEAPSFDSVQLWSKSGHSLPN